MKGVRQTIKAKEIPRAVYADAHRGFDDTLDTYTLPWVGHNAVIVWTHTVNEWWMKTDWFPPYYSNTVQLDKYDHVTLFLYASLIPHDYRAHVLFLRNRSYISAKWFGKQ